MVGYWPKKKPINNSGNSLLAIKPFLWGVFMLLVIIIVIWCGRFWINIIRKLPDIREIENFNFKQATIITDRNGQVLYRMFEENRQYVPYKQISKNFINAIVATEDKRFRDNVGIDIIGIVRAWITDITQGKTHWASTITQQLIKLIMLSPEKKIERKLKEIILAVRIGQYIKKDIAKTSKWASQEEIDQQVKEKIMELYANLIFLWNNAYGIEAASQTYFNKKASELSILEWAILAGMPQAPSRYDPFTNKELLLWKIIVTDSEKNPVDTSTVQNQILEKVWVNIEKSKLWNRNNDQEILDYIKNVLDFTVEDSFGKTLNVSYELWRKDVVLARLFEEKYITEFELKKAFIESLNFSFHRGSTSIKAPHFVFRVINQLQKQYSEEMLQKWWLTIVTSLDYEIQKLAEQSIEENSEKLKSNLANNAAMIYMDSQNGDILAYVWSRDYNNTEIDGQVDIIQANRQPWSTVKPLLYALWFMKLALTIDSPIYDIKMKIDKDEPNNADGTFWGLSTLRQSLAWSRNIPAIKMFFSVWGETPVKNFFSELWITWLQWWSNHYGYPLAIGASEIKMFDLATAYMHLSAFGRPAQPNPILEIRWPNNNLLYKKEVETQKQVIPAGVAYLIRKILVDTNNYPESRIPMFTAPWKLSFATKSGTTNVVKWEEKLPRDGWLMTYTPSKVLWLRAWNTDGKPLHKDAYGWRINSSTWKSFVKKLIDGGYIQNELPSETETKEVTISKLSGKLASAQTPLSFTKRTLAYLQTAPTEYDASSETISIDSACNGIPSEVTPPSDLSTAYYIRPQTIMPDGRDQKDINTRRSTVGVENYKNDIWTIILQPLTGSCTTRSIQTLWDVSLNIIKPLPGEKITKKFSLWHQSKSSNPIATVKVYLDDKELKVINYKKSSWITDINTISIPEETPVGNYNLKIVVLDSSGASDSKTIEVNLVANDSTAPYIMENKIKVTKQADGNYEIVLLFADESSTVREGSIEQAWKLLATIKNNMAIFSVVSLEQEITWKATDEANNTAQWTVTLSTYNKDSSAQ